MWLQYLYILLQGHVLFCADVFDFKGYGVLKACENYYTFF